VRPAAGFFAEIWHLPPLFPVFGAQRGNPGRHQVKLVAVVGENAWAGWLAAASQQGFEFSA